MTTKVIYGVRLLVRKIETRVSSSFGALSGILHFCISFYRHVIQENRPCPHFRILQR